MATVTEKIRGLAPDERFCLFEFFPPKTDAGFRNLLARLNRMMALNPLFITVTWGAGGSTSEKSLDLAATCQNELGITTVLHLTCTNTNKEVIDNALARAKANGIRNILALRGDPPRNKEYWTPNCDFNNAVDLVRYIREQYGDYFCVGVAGYPEGHVDGADTTHQDPARDLPYLVEKVQAGADFIVTQLFFDVDKFVAYEQLLQNTPELKNTVLIPGLMPVTTYKVFTRATKLSHALIPPAILARFEANSLDDDMVKTIGIEVLNHIISEIVERTNGRVRGFHFYTLNLEKAVASIIESSPILQLVSHNQAVDHDDAIELDSDLEDVPVARPNRRKSSVNENLLVKPGNLDPKRILVSKALSKDRQTLVDISTGKGALGKDATWDEYPNGRFGDSNSPAYGEIDGYGPSLKLHSVKEVIDTWGEPKSAKDIGKVFASYLSDKIQVLPWVSSELSPETALIQEQLFEFNERGWFTLASQPAVNGCPSNDAILGWGPRNGRLFQKSFVEFFVPKKEWDSKIFPRLAKEFEDCNITYFRGNSSGEITSNLPIGKDSRNHKSAVTWGVFPNKEVLQPTVIDFESFKAWNEEAFLLWQEWARCYKKTTESYQVLNSVYTDYYLVSMVHHNFMDEYALWNTLLEE